RRGSVAETSRELGLRRPVVLVVVHDRWAARSARHAAPLDQFASRRSSVDGRPTTPVEVPDLSIAATSTAWRARCSGDERVPPAPWKPGGWRAAAAPRRVRPPRGEPERAAG